MSEERERELIKIKFVKNEKIARQKMMMIIIIIEDENLNAWRFSLFFSKLFEISS